MLNRLISHLRAAVSSDAARDIANDLETCGDRLADECKITEADIESALRDPLAVKQAPALKGDGEGDLLPNGKIERRIVWNLIDKLTSAGFLIVGVDDGDDKPVKCSDAMAAMEAVFAVDQARLLFKKPGTRGSSHAILLIGGNGESVISDWNYTAGDPDGFNAIMEAFAPGENW